MYARHAWGARIARSSEWLFTLVACVLIAAAATFGVVYSAINGEFDWPFFLYIVAAAIFGFLAVRTWAGGVYVNTDGVTAADEYGVRRILWSSIEEFLVENPNSRLNARLVVQQFDDRKVVLARPGVAVLADQITDTANALNVELRKRRDHPGAPPTPPISSSF